MNSKSFFFSDLENGKLSFPENDEAGDSYLLNLPVPPNGIS
jgi:hypothetical protein